MKNFRDFVNAACVASVGGAVGACTHAAIGGVGIAATGTGFGITFGPFIAIGSGIGLAGYGIYWLGKEMERGSGKTPRGAPNA